MLRLFRSAENSYFPVTKSLHYSHKLSLGISASERACLYHNQLS
jgi:hypothetical protein